MTTTVRHLLSRPLSGAVDGEDCLLARSALDHDEHSVTLATSRRLQVLKVLRRADTFFRRADIFF